MHSILVNEAFLRLSLLAEGPILVKAGEGGADPTLPDMEFVRTRRNGSDCVYLPGSSLKGALRAHCEKILRSIAPARESRRYACDPTREPCINRPRKDWKGFEVYKESCRACRLFGNTSLRGRLALSDAYPAGEVRLEERNGVAIDRVYGSVSGGKLYNYEVVTSGQFDLTVHLRNFTVGQMGLLAFALRDLRDGRLALGFGKSRGLGRVGLRIRSFSVCYPAATVQNGTLRLPAGEVGRADQLLGIGCFPVSRGYETPGESDRLDLPPGVKLTGDDWGQARVELQDQQAWALLAACARRMRDSL